MVLIYTVETHTVDGTTKKEYLGFNRLSQENAKKAKFVVICRMTGEVEKWIYQPGLIGDGIDALSELQRYYKETYGWDTVNLEVQ